MNLMRFPIPSPAAFLAATASAAAEMPVAKTLGVAAIDINEDGRMDLMVANDTPVAYHPPLAVWALLLIGPLALLAASLLAAWPGQRAARLSSAQILRAE